MYVNIENRKFCCPPWLAQAKDYPGLTDVFSGACQQYFFNFFKSIFIECGIIGYWLHADQAMTDVVNKQQSTSLFWRLCLVILLCIICITVVDLY